jgi:hypothetical protein
VESFMEESDIIMEDTPEATLVTSLATQIQPIADDALKTLSPNRETNLKKMVWDGCGKWIAGFAQETVFRSINFTAMKMQWRVTSWLQLEIGISRLLTYKDHVWPNTKKWLWLLKIWQV